MGTYEVNVTKIGFNQYRQTGLVVDVNSALVVDARLEIGGIKQDVSVSSTAVQVDTATSQIGEVITGTKMTTMPFLGPY